MTMWNGAQSAVTVRDNGYCKVCRLCCARFGEIQAAINKQREITWGYCPKCAAKKEAKRNNELPNEMPEATYK